MFCPSQSVVDAGHDERAEMMDMIPHMRSVCDASTELNEADSTMTSTAFQPPPCLARFRQHRPRSAASRGLHHTVCRFVLIGVLLSALLCLNWGLRRRRRRRQRDWRGQAQG